MAKKSLPNLDASHEGAKTKVVGTSEALKTLARCEEGLLLGLDEIIFHLNWLKELRLAIKKPHSSKDAKTILDMTNCLALVQTRLLQTQCMVEERAEKKELLAAGAETDVDVLREAAAILRDRKPSGVRLGAQHPTVTDELPEDEMRKKRMATSVA
jgi:hypothetical protein